MSNILWLTWKDCMHPGAGGAEVVLRELSRRLVREGHSVTWLTCGYDGAAGEETIDGIRVIRIGATRYTHPLRALVYYVRRLRSAFDIVIEVVNTAPYFGVFFGHKNVRRFLFYHQLAREIWFHEAPPPISQLGYTLEPLATRLLSTARVPVITVSESTKADLARFGFSPQRVRIISEGIELDPLAKLETAEKYPVPTMLSLGAMRAMKRTVHHIEAFNRAKQLLPALQLKVAGDAGGPYGQKVLQAIADSPHRRDIEYLGRVSQGDKIALMRRSHVIVQTALKEGWGLTITEAASQGTPAVAYDVDGLRDSIRHGETGLLTVPNSHALARGVAQLLSDSGLYERLRRSAWQWSKHITFDRSYQDFKEAVGLL